MEKLDMECCVDDLVGNILQNLQVGKTISPTFFTFTEDKAYIIDLLEYNDPKEAFMAVKELHKTIKQNNWIDIYVSECKIKEDKILHFTSEEGDTAIVLLPITPDKQEHFARVIQYDHDKDGLRLYPEKLMYFNLKELSS